MTRKPTTTRCVDCGDPLEAFDQSPALCLPDAAKPLPCALSDCTEPRITEDEDAALFDLYPHLCHYHADCERYLTLCAAANEYDYDVCVPASRATKNDTLTVQTPDMKR